MDFVGKFINSLSSFPKYNALSADIEELQRHDNKILNGIQDLIGPSFNDFAKTQATQLREGLFTLQDIARMEASSLRTLFSETSMFSNNIKQINIFHDSIVKQRKEINELQEKFDKYQKRAESFQNKNSKDKTFTFGLNKLLRGNKQMSYEECCAKKNKIYEILEEKKKENEKQEKEYQKTLIQIIITAFDTYVSAYAKCMKEIANYAQKMNPCIDTIYENDDDSSINELEARLKLLESEDLD